MIRIDAMWLAIEPLDMRAGADRLMARVVEVFGAAQAHHGYLFANARGTRIKLLVHDGFGVWCATRRLNQGRFIWPGGGLGAPQSLTREQLDALVLGLPSDAVDVHVQFLGGGFGRRLEVDFIAQAAHIAQSRSAFVAQTSAARPLG